MTQKWIWQLRPKVITFILLWILTNGTNIICLSSKSMQFCKIQRLWLKNWACHAHLNFKIQKGVEGHTLLILKKYVLIINVQMILLSYFDIPNQKFINWKRPIFLVHDRPPYVTFYVGRPILRLENHICSVYRFLVKFT